MDTSSSRLRRTEALCSRMGSAMISNWEPPYCPIRKTLVHHADVEIPIANTAWELFKSSNISNLTLQIQKISLKTFYHHISSHFPIPKENRKWNGKHGNHITCKFSKKSSKCEKSHKAEIKFEEKAVGKVKNKTTIVNTFPPFRFSATSSHEI